MHRRHFIKSVNHFLVFLGNTIDIVCIDSWTLMRNHWPQAYRGLRNWMLIGIWTKCLIVKIRMDTAWKRYLELHTVILIHVLDTVPPPSKGGGHYGKEWDISFNLWKTELCFNRPSMSMNWVLILWKLISEFESLSYMVWKKNSWSA